MGGLPLRAGASAELGWFWVLFHLGTAWVGWRRTPGSRAVATRAGRVVLHGRWPGWVVWTGSTSPGLSRGSRCPRPSGLHRARGRPVRGFASMRAGWGRGPRAEVPRRGRRQLPRRLPDQAAGAERVASLDASQQRLPRRQRLSRWRLPRQRRQHLPKRWRLPKQRRQHLPKQRRSAFRSVVASTWRSLPRRRLPLLAAAKRHPLFATSTDSTPSADAYSNEREMSAENDAPENGTSFPRFVDRLFRRSGSRLTRVDCGLRVRESWVVSSPWTEPSRPPRNPTTSRSRTWARAVLWFARTVRSHDHGTPS